MFLLYGAAFPLSCGRQAPSSRPARGAVQSRGAGTLQDLVEKGRWRDVDALIAGIHVGASKGEVLAVLGAPDEIHQTYRPPLLGARRSGVRYLYNLGRIGKTDSCQQTTGSLFVVHFDNSGHVAEFWRDGLGPTTRAQGDGSGGAGGRHDSADN